MNQGTAEYVRFDEPKMLADQIIYVGREAIVDVYIPGEVARCAYAPGLGGQFKQKNGSVLYRFRVVPTAKVGDIFGVSISGATPISFRIKVGK